MVGAPKLNPGEGRNFVSTFRAGDGKLSKLPYCLQFTHFQDKDAYVWSKVHSAHLSSLIILIIKRKCNNCQNHLALKGNTATTTATITFQVTVIKIEDKDGVFF